MIFCPVCKTANDDFSTVCSQCHGFLQNRIVQLDLFETAWNVIVDPAQAFRTITLAEHKSFAYSLFSFFGIGLAFASLWFFRIGDRFDSLLQLIIFCCIGGSAFGFIIAPIFSFIHFLITRALRAKGGFKDSLAISAYALVPVILSIIFILPIELLSFGVYLFSFNPSPATLQPYLYYTFISLDGVCAVWSIVLMILGTRISFRLPILGAVTAAIFSLCASGYGYYIGALKFIHFFNK